MPGNGADFFITLLVKYFQTENDSLIVIESEQRIFNHFDQFPIEHRSFGKHSDRFQSQTFRFIETYFHFLFTRFTRRFTDDISRNPEKPGGKPQLIPQSAEVAISPDEGLLRQFLSQFTVMHLIIDEAENRSPVAVEDQMESLLITAFRARDHARRYLHRTHPSP